MYNVIFLNQEFRRFFYPKELGRVFHSLAVLKSVISAVTVLKQFPLKGKNFFMQALTVLERWKIAHFCVLVSHYINLWLFHSLRCLPKPLPTKSLWLQSANELQVLRYCDYSDLLRIKQEAINLGPASISSDGPDLFFKAIFTFPHTCKKINNFLMVQIRVVLLNEGSRIGINISYE